MSDGLIALAGTTLGSTLTFGFQYLAGRQNANRSHWSTVRKERLDAFTDLAAALINFRRTQVDRRLRQFDDGQPGELAKLGIDVRDARAAARTAFARVRLLTSDEKLHLSIQQTLDHIRDIKSATDAQAVDDAGAKAHEMIEAIISTARDDLD